SLLDQSHDGVLSRRLLRHGARGHRQPYGLRRHDRGVSRVFQIPRQRSVNAGAGIRLSRPQTRRPLVPLRTPLARSARGRPSAARGLARHARRRARLLLARRPQALRGGSRLSPAASMVAYILLGCVVILGLVAVMWGVGSRRRSIPCPVWLRWLVEVDNPFTQTNQAAVIVERLELQPGMAVLDAGCGPGRLAIPIARQVGARGGGGAMDI